MRGFVGGMARAREIVLALAAASRGNDHAQDARVLEAAARAIQAEADREPTEPRIECCQGCGRPRRYEG